MKRCPVTPRNTVHTPLTWSSEENFNQSIMPGIINLFLQPGLCKESLIFFSFSS